MILKKMGEYLKWADSTIWGIVQSLTDEEFEQGFGEHGRSIRDRYIHLARDGWEWYHDWMGTEPKEIPRFDTMSRTELFDFASEFNQKWISLIDDRSVDSLELHENGKKVTISFEEIFFHIVNHVTYHRGQIAMGLRLLDRAVHMTDYVPFRMNTA